jgi:hypothetical protein
VSLADELKALQELHEKGKLTDKEFADAKAATLNKQEPTEDLRVKKPFLSWPTIVLIVLFVVFVGLAWYNLGTKNTTQLIATVAHAPITLNDSVENISAASWKGVGLNLPYSGTIEVSLQVVQGNPIDVFLVTPDQVDRMNKADWIHVQAYGDFNATKTKTYRRTGRLEQGSYYLVLRDTSLGIFSSSASDISVKARLNP